MALKIVFFDCDGTLTKVKSSWEYLHRRLNLWNGKADLYERLFEKGLINYHEFCKKDALLWKGLKVEDVMKIIEEIPLFEGSKELISYLKERGIFTAIVSTGLSFVVERVKKELSIDLAISNELLSEKGIITGEIKINVEYGKKGYWVKKILKELGLKKEEAAAVGDGKGDGDMFLEVSFPIGFNIEGIDEDLLKCKIEGNSLFAIKRFLEPLL